MWIKLVFHLKELTLYPKEYHGKNMTNSSYKKDKYPKETYPAISKQEAIEIDIQPALDEFDFKRSMGIPMVEKKLRKKLKMTLVGDIVTFYSHGIPSRSFNRHEWKRLHAEYKANNSNVQT